MTGLAVPALAIWLAAAVHAPGGQAPAPTPEPSPARAPAAQGAAGSIADYQAGPGDVLSILVFGHPELSRSAPVQPNGVIALPLLREVPVAGLTVTEIQRKLTALLERDFIVNPQVEITVASFQSNYVIVLGEVKSPGRRLLRGKTRLIDLLVEAGGFTPAASGEVVVTRTDGTFDGGSDTLRLKISWGGALSAQDRINLELVLKNGDFVVASPKSYVTVEGEVARPGRYPIEEGFGVSAAITAAGGLTRYAGSKVRVVRTDAETGQTEVLEVDVKEIRKGKRPDVPIDSSAVITVPRRKF